MVAASAATSAAASRRGMITLRPAAAVQTTALFRRDFGPVRIPAGTTSRSFRKSESSF